MDHSNIAYNTTHTHTRAMTPNARVSGWFALSEAIGEILKCRCMADRLRDCPLVMAQLHHRHHLSVRK